MNLGRRIAFHVEFYFRQIWNWRSIVYSDLLLPAVYMCLLAAGLNAAVGRVEIGEGARVPYVDYVFAGIVALLASRAWGRTTSAVSNDRKWGTYALRMLGGFRRTDYLCSVLAVACVLYLTQLTVLVCAAAVSGASYSSVRLVGSIPVGLLAVAFWGALGTTVALLIKNYQQRELVLSLSSLPIVFSAPIFYSASDAPIYLRLLAGLNPLTYQVRAIRSVLFGNPAVGSMAVVFVTTAIVVVWALQSLRRADLVSSER